MKKRKTHSADFKAKVTLDVIRENMTMAELSKKYGVHANQISTWKRAAIENMSSAFQRKGTLPELSRSTVSCDTGFVLNGSYERGTYDRNYIQSCGLK